VAQGRVSGGASGIGAFKAAMKSLGIIDTAIMPRPRAPLNAEETARIDGILRETGLLQI
jgi:4-hydroxy-tetrahydrodipicolinate synthase